MESVVDLGSSIFLVCFLVVLFVAGGLVFVNRPGPPELRLPIQIAALLVQHAVLLAVLWNIRSIQLLVVIQTAFLMANSLALAMLHLRASGSTEPVAGAERRHIARELHDAVGNNLTVISLHARMGRAQPERQLELIDETAQRTMRHVGEILHVLRSGTAVVEEERGDLAETVRGAVEDVQHLSPPIRVRMTGERGVHLPAGVRRVVRRVVNEALLNGVKHGPLDEAVVELHADEEIELRVLTRRAAEPNDQSGSAPSDAAHDPDRSEPGRAAPLVGFGFGLRGLAEQLHALGGRLCTGTTRGGWFRVEARIPLTGAGERRLLA
jgi:signal transduction histidine kinase